MFMKFIIIPIRAKCSFTKISNLREGTRFLNRKKPIAFVKAAKEMAAVLQTSVAKKTTVEIPYVYEQYMKLLEE